MSRVCVATSRWIAAVGLAFTVFCSPARTAEPSSASTRWEDAALAFVAVLSEGDSESAAVRMVYPSSFTPEQLNSERENLARALGHAINWLGRPEAAKMAKREVEFYEFAVGGGPRPYWWRAEYPASMDVVVLVAFQRVGTGVIRLSLVKVQGKPKVAAVGFGLDVRRPGAREEIADLTKSLFDLFGVPEDHPARRVELTPVRVPLADH